jgi:DNA-binding GntR family transcriptional regulator
MTSTAAPRSNKLPSPYERLKEAILAGELAPGQPLIEAALAERYSVSRTPIREALMRLEQDAIVVRTERGLVIRERSPSEILDLYETRIVLEGAAASSAALRRGNIDMIALRRALAAGQAVQPDDEAGMMSTNRGFHRAVWQASHNESLIDLLARLDTHLARYPATTLSYPGRWESALQQHQDLAAAIAARDPRRADALATSHFTEARDIRLQVWEEQGVF